MTKWFETLSGLKAAAWATLQTGVKQADHPARLPSFATVSATGYPEVRTVVLRAADPAQGAVSVHTDLYSPKVASLRATPLAAIHIWDETQALQLRLSVEVTIQHGAEVGALWGRIPDHAQQSYGVTPSPGTPIANALDYRKEPDPDSFAVLHCTVMRLDVVHLGDQHRRAEFTRDSGWVGQWLAP
ncbi:pyridoxamine 5'-phosphate oxidase family protein [Loktanella sp. S4079]|uniref:pyridoxamine 5'-phosphate oxidase family protein n=1 Tax=Loktanella sp. S4079 TaxID=579483 RepID=UPI0005F9F286|nr:pyridoxamine 5'-phosphate oxidase family protein [Loktanella sp. S4079]KJZ18959.1 pyridoxamine 5'-phosphate oxidase [Loktanella sp. S4079]